MFLYQSVSVQGPYKLRLCLLADMLSTKCMKKTPMCSLCATLHPARCVYEKVELQIGSFVTARAALFQPGNVLFLQIFIIWLNSNTCHPKRTKRAKIVEFLQKSFATSHSTQQTSVHQVAERRVMHIFVFVFYSHLSCMYLYLSRMYLYLYLLHYPRSMLADVSFYPFSS